MKRLDQLEVTSQQIVDYINDPVQKALQLIAPWRGTRFVVFGASGSGKTRAIDLANDKLPADEQIAESRELVRERDPLKALEVLEGRELEYEGSMHIAFTVYSRDLSKALESKGVKVFWLDSGSSCVEPVRP